MTALMFKQSKKARNMKKIMKLSEGNDLSDVELSSVRGGSAERDSLCGEIQEMASRHGEHWSDEEWDAWGKMYDEHC